MQCIIADISENRLCTGILQKQKSLQKRGLPYVSGVMIVPAIR